MVKIIRRLRRRRRKILLILDFLGTRNGVVFLGKGGDKILLTDVEIHLERRVQMNLFNKTLTYFNQKKIKGLYELWGKLEGHK